MNLSPGNKNLFTISFVLFLQNKISPNREILLKGVFNPLASWILVNLNFLLLQDAHFDKDISFPLLVFATFGFLLSFFVQFKQYNSFSLYIV